jgi:predicted nucleic acid-binding Zn ribbon protein
MALGHLSRAWTQVVGEHLARQSAPRALDGGALLVAAASAAWGSQVRFLGSQIARRANEVLGWNAVKNVRVTVATDVSKPLSRNAFGGPNEDPESTGKGVH